MSVVVSVAANGFAADKVAGKRPNILICVADDAGHASAYGTKWVSTPVFDRVARDGVLMNHAYTCNAKSAPSRASMLTGRNSWQLEEAGNHWPAFPLKFKTYPEALAEKGYVVGYTGKGWGPGVALNADSTERRLTGKPWNKIKCVPPTTGINKIDYAANFKAFLAKRDGSKPFCFWYGAREPHRKYEYRSHERFGKQISDIDSVPPYWPDNETVRHDMLDYAVEIEYFDRQLGLMLQMLEQSGELDNTIVMELSDHNMPFPRCKGQDYYESVHIPMAVMWRDGIVNPGRRLDENICVIDIVPTLFDAIGVRESDTGMMPVTGRSFMDLLKDSDRGVDRDFVLLGRERHDVGRPDDQGYPIRGLIRGDYLYIRNYEPGRWPACNPETGYMDVDGSPTKTEVLKTRHDPATRHFWELSFGKRDAEELYNIKTDPACVNNLIGDPAMKPLAVSMAVEMESRLKSEGDPRMSGHGDVFDRYPNQCPARQFYRRWKTGERNIPHAWINDSDFETIE